MATRNILITGASSGIGAALARAYAAAGATLILWGRDEARLDAIAAECRALGAGVETQRLDLRDIDAMRVQLRALDARRPLELAIFNAGVGGVAGPERFAEPPGHAQNIAMVNFTAPVVGATELAELMGARGKGHIVLMSSIAGSFPLPMAPAYAASKAGLTMFAEALEIRMAKHGVAVTLVSPGFIDTPMSRGVTSYMPFLMHADDAAKIIAGKVARRRTRVVVPWPFAVIRAASRLLPRAITRAVLRRR